MKNEDKLLGEIYHYLETKTGKSDFRPGVDKVSVSGAVIEPEDIMMVIATALEGWFTEGQASKEFSDNLKNFLGVRHISLCNSGSSANLLAVNVMKHKQKYYGKYVVTPATGFPTTVYPIYQVGFEPLFVDVDPITLNIPTDTVLELLERKDVVGFIGAHILGFPFRVDILQNSSNKFIVNDCCDALGTTINDVPIGKFGNISTFSFFPAHNITTGEGGALATDNGRLYKEINSFRDWGRDCYCLPGESNTCNKRFEWEFEGLPKGWDHKYTFTRLGYNLKITDLQSALGLAQIQRLDEFTKIRQRNFECFAWELTKRDYYLNHILIAGNYYDNSNSVSPFGIPILVQSDKFTRQEIVEHLENAKIATRPIFAGNLVRQPVFKNRSTHQIGNLSGSDTIMKNAFWIGCWHGLNTQHMDYILEQFDSFFEGK